MTADERPQAPSPKPSEAAIIDVTFRSGSLTAIGIIIGFSLNFMTRGASSPGDWTRVDLVSAIAITIGIALQIKALASLLMVGSLALKAYNLQVKIFLFGLSFVAIGVVIAVFADVVSGQRTGVL
jgi:hypothetical protein